MSNSINDIEKITIGRLLHSLKPGQLSVLIGILFTLIGGAFGLGINWEMHRYDTEIVPLKNSVEELKKKNSSLKKDIYFYRGKDKLISLTSALQFQASIRGIEHNSLYACSSDRQKLTDQHVANLYSEYLSTIEEVTKPRNENEPVARKGPVSRACSTRLIEFNKDQSAAYIINNFIQG
jgi:hypothetical protein